MHGVVSGAVMSPGCKPIQCLLLAIPHEQISPFIKIITHLGSQHPSPDVITLCNFETQIWLEIITSRDAQSACFKGSRMSCTEIIFGILGGKFWPEKITSRDGCFLLIICVLRSRWCGCRRTALHILQSNLLGS